MLVLLPLLVPQLAVPVRAVAEKVFVVDEQLLALLHLLRGDQARDQAPPRVADLVEPAVGQIFLIFFNLPIFDFSKYVQTCSWVGRRG